VLLPKFASPLYVATIVWVPAEGKAVHVAVPPLTDVPTQPEMLLPSLVKVAVLSLTVPPVLATVAVNVTA
jgi:hypothetical protein